MEHYPALEWKDSQATSLEDITLRETGVPGRSASTGGSQTGAGTTALSHATVRDSQSTAVLATMQRQRGVSAGALGTRLCEQWDTPKA